MEALHHVPVADLEGEVDAGRRLAGVDPELVGDQMGFVAYRWNPDGVEHGGIETLARLQIRCAKMHMIDQPPTMQLQNPAPLPIQSGNALPIPGFRRCEPRPAR